MLITLDFPGFLRGVGCGSRWWRGTDLSKGTQYCDNLVQILDAQKRKRAIKNSLIVNPITVSFPQNSYSNSLPRVCFLPYLCFSHTQIHVRDQLEMKLLGTTTQSYLPILKVTVRLDRQEISYVKLKSNQLFVFSLFGNRYFFHSIGSQIYSERESKSSFWSKKIVCIIRTMARQREAAPITAWFSSVCQKSDWQIFITWALFFRTEEEINCMRFYCTNNLPLYWDTNSSRCHSSP